MCAAIDACYTWLAVLTVINSAISLVYYWRVVAPAYLGAPAAARPKLGRLAGTAVAVAAMGVVVVGCHRRAVAHRVADPHVGSRLNRSLLRAVASAER